MKIENTWLFDKIVNFYTKGDFELFDVLSDKPGIWLEVEWVDCWEEV